MFIAYLFLCNSLVSQCVGLEDHEGVSAAQSSCEKRIEEMLNVASELMPRYRVVHVGCKKIPGFSI